MSTGSAQLDRVLERLKRQRLEVAPPGQPMPNSRLFTKAAFDHAERPLLIHQGGTFYNWNGKCWPELDNSTLRAQLYMCFEHAIYLQATRNGYEERPFAPNSSKVTNLVDALKAISHVGVETSTPSWFADQNYRADEIVACTNGLVHVPRRTLLAHTPTFYVHHSIPFDFEATAPTPERWHKFLGELWPGDEESISTLQEIFGYLVSGDTRQQKIVLLVGPKRSGKGTIARILTAMLGAHNVVGPTLAALGTNFGLQPLIGKPAAIIADARLTGQNSSIVTERLLTISGEDMLTVDRKYREPWTGRLPSRIVILSNELPKLADSSGALASRFIVLTMRQSFYGRENLNLTAELSSELPGIFN